MEPNHKLVNLHQKALVIVESPSIFENLLIAYESLYAKCSLLIQAQRLLIWPDASLYGVSCSLFLEQKHSSLGWE